MYIFKVISPYRYLELQSIHIKILLPSPIHNCVPIPSVRTLIPNIINTYIHFLNPIIQYTYSCFRIALSTLLKKQTF